MSDHPQIHHKRRRSQLLAYRQHLLYGLTSQQHLFAGRFLRPAVVQTGTSRIDQSSTGNHPPLGGSGCSSLWTTSRFQLLEGESIDSRKYGLRDNVAQLSVFEVVVVNCKLLFLCSAISSRLMGSVSDERMLEICIIGWVEVSNAISVLKAYISDATLSPEVMQCDLFMLSSSMDDIALASLGIQFDSIP
ncbi:hypothetical protein CQW23_11403 [Capsicum baccatum]|uniref:Uncharacterized protein n=1 Tax=Capsicum baccatum TaxID=33114 RepID=A0A2G2WPM7_CAPBA|nr:hypothetical protein CQW23_11403 [Capsicum baccatum]